MTTVDEIAPDIFRISTFVPEYHLQFGQFLVRDDEPLLFHTGLRAMFPLVRDAVASLIDPRRLRWIGFSHFEALFCSDLLQQNGNTPASTESDIVGATAVHARHRSDRTRARRARAEGPRDHARRRVSRRRRRGAAGGRRRVA